MPRWISRSLMVGGWTLCCLAAVQISQLLDGRAVPDLLNYGLTLLTSVAGLGLTLAGFQTPAASRRVSTPSLPPDQRPLVAAIDLLFAHFRDDSTAQEAVRVVARSVTEKRYRTVP